MAEDRMRSVREAGCRLQGPSGGRGGTADGSGTPGSLPGGTELISNDVVSPRTTSQNMTTVWAPHVRPGRPQPLSSWRSRSGGRVRARSEEHFDQPGSMDAPQPPSRGGQAGGPGEPRRPRDSGSLGPDCSYHSGGLPRGWWIQTPGEANSSICKLRGAREGTGGAP